MSSPRLHGATIALCLLLTCRFGWAVDAPQGGPQPMLSESGNPQPAPPPVFAPSEDLGPANSTPAMMALPVDNSSNASPGAEARKWYSISVALRETYDDNTNTTSTNEQAALETSLSPSLLIDAPYTDGHLTARFTFNATYYDYLNKGSNTNAGGSADNDPLQYSSDFIVQYNHAFSTRFNLSVADNPRYYTDPSVFESTGTNYQDGPYITNTLNGSFTAQWTPLWGTSTNYSNTVTAYEQSSVADSQNSVENTGSQSVSYSILPKIAINAGGTVDSLSYETADRGYTSYTAFIGGSWAALPSLSLTANGGGSYTQTVQSANQGGSNEGLSPYGAVSLAWTLGKRSSLSFTYSHEITPTDQSDANGQSSDRFTANFSYQITPSVSTFLQGIYTLSDVSGSLIANNAISAYTESDYALNTGVTYHCNNFLDFDFNLSTTGVSSGIATLDYSRQEASFGIRGTY